MPHCALMLCFRNVLALGFCAIAGSDGVQAQSIGDPARGERVYGICRPCHSIGPGAQHKTGPHLNGLFDRPAGQIEGYASSLPMTAAGLRGMIWNDETLDDYLLDPIDAVPYGSMSVVGVLDDQRRADLIAYLRETSLPPETDPAPSDIRENESESESADSSD